MAPGVEHVFRSHAGVVRRALRSLGVDAAVLDDAMQDVFVVLVRRASDFDGRNTMTNWLWGIARRVARGYRRGAARRERLHAALPRTHESAGLDDDVARRRALELVDTFVHALPQALFETFVLAEIEGRTAPEIAAATGANLNTVYARIRTVRRRFDAAIAGELAPARTFALLPWLWPGWAPATASTVVACTIGLAHVVALAPSRVESVAAGAARIDDEPAKDEAMTRKLVIPLVTGAVATALVAAPASAKPKPRRAKTEAVAPAPKKPVQSDQDADSAACQTSELGDTTCWFENDVVGGDVLKPEGQNLHSHGRSPFGSLIRLRGHFLPELVTLATDV